MSLKQENLNCPINVPDPPQSKRLLYQPTCRRKRHKFVDRAALDLSDTTTETNINLNLRTRYSEERAFELYGPKKNCLIVQAKE